MMTDILHCWRCKSEVEWDSLYETAEQRKMRYSEVRDLFRRFGCGVALGNPECSKVSSKLDKSRRILRWIYENTDFDTAAYTIQEAIRDGHLTV